MLRAAYPQLETRLFQIGPHAFRIVFDRSILSADKIRDEFEHNVCPMTLQVEVSNDVPANFLREISPMGDHELALGFAGFPLTRDDIRTILSGKFPELPELISIGNTKHPIFTLRFARKLTAHEQGVVRTFFDQWESGWPIEFAVNQPKTDSHAPAPAIPGEILRIRSARLRPTAPRFVQDDEAFWFDHIDAIFEGGIHPSSILDVESTGTACYLDASVLPQVDLRQAVICYDTVFMSPPLSDGSGRHSGRAKRFSERTLSNSLRLTGSASSSDSRKSALTETSSPLSTRQSRTQLSDVARPQHFLPPILFRPPMSTDSIKMALSLTSPRLPGAWPLSFTYLKEK